MNSKQACLLLASLTVLVQPACYSYWKGDALPISTNSSYCRNPHPNSVPHIVWPVSDLVLNTTAARDSLALAYYQDIYNNSYLGGGVSE